METTVGLHPVLPGDGLDVEECGGATLSDSKEELRVAETGTLREAPMSYVYWVAGPYCLMFVAFASIQGFLTTVLGDIAFDALAVLYGCFMVANFFAPRVVLLAGDRLSMGLAASSYTLFCGCATLAAYGIAPEIIFFGAVAIGVGAAVFWCAQGSYMTSLARPSRIGTWQGRFFGVFMLAPIIGQGIVLLIIDVAGATEQLLFASLFGVSSLALLSFLLVRRRPAYLPAREATPHDEKGVLQHALVTLRLGLELNAWLPGALFLTSGFNQAFFFGVTAQRIASSSTTAFALLANGFCAVFGSIIFGKLSDTISRKGVILVSLSCVTLSHCLAAPAIVLVDASPSQVGNATADALFLAAFAVFGISEGGLQTQGRACITVLFPGRVESGFGFLLFCLAFAAAMGFVYGSRLVYYGQAAIVAATVLIAFIMVFVVRLPGRGAVADAGVVAAALAPSSDARDNSSSRGKMPVATATAEPD